MDNQIQKVEEVIKIMNMLGGWNKTEKGFQLIALVNGVKIKVNQSNSVRYSGNKYMVINNTNNHQYLQYKQFQQQEQQIQQIIQTLNSMSNKYYCQRIYQYDHNHYDNKNIIAINYQQDQQHDQNYQN